MTLRARGRAGRVGPAQRSTWRRDSAEAPSLVVARMTRGPAVLVLKRRARKLVVPRAAPSCAFGSLRAVHSSPPTQTRRPAGGTPSSPVASTRMSSNCPAGRMPPSGGMMRMVVAAVAGAPHTSRNARTSRA